VSVLVGVHILYWNVNGLDFASSGGLDFASALGLDFASALGFRLCVDPFTLNCAFTNIYVAIDSSIEFSEFSVEVDIFFSMLTDLFLALQLTFLDKALLQ
jgi:hypothetical protein